jgi:dTDP-4-dehydrorhamnose 3,5-epimerase
VGVELSGQNHRQLWIPPGFGHGFVVLSEFADVLYKTSEYWIGDYDRALRWDDRHLAIDWPTHGTPILSVKDSNAPMLIDAEVFE